MLIYTLNSEKMAKNLESNWEHKEGIKVEGDLGDILVAEESSDSENDQITQTCNAPNTLSTIPTSLVHTASVPVFGNVSVSDSDNIQLGNNTYFNGPVTIKQIIQNKTGVANAAYTSNDDESRSEVPPHSKNAEILSLKKYQILFWHKATVLGVCLAVLIAVLTITLVANQIQTRTQQSTDVPPKYEAENSISNVVEGICNDNFQVIVISVIILPLTFMLIFLSLLTKGPVFDDEYIKGNCLDKHCKNCFKEAGPDVISPDYLRIVSRTDWLAQPVEAPLDPIRQPAPWVIITHTATETCNTQSQCVLRVRQMQTFHIESRGWYDIGYNFLVGGDGSVYYGRGWDHIGAHTQGYNKYSIGIAFIGTFNTSQPPKRQIEACQKLIQVGLKLGKIAKDYKLFGHRQLMSTLSPGDTLYNIIKTWPNFVSNVTMVNELLPNY